METLRFQQAFLHPKYWLLWLGLGLLWLTVQLPYALLRHLAKVVGWVLYLIAGKRRRIIQRNLALCFPELSFAERQRLVRQNFSEMGMALFEMAMSWWWPKPRLAKLLTVQGLEHLQQAAANQQGVILMAAHRTSLEIGAALLGQLHTIDGMYRQHKNPLFDYVQRQGRERHNADASAIERDDVRGMLKVLRKGRAIWYAPDQDYGRKQSLFVPLFGIPAATVTATSKFAKLGKAIVIPMRQARTEHGYSITIEPPLTDFPGADDYADCLRINQWVESVIKEHPEQYLWAHRRFKTRPAGETKLY